MADPNLNDPAIQRIVHDPEWRRDWAFVNQALRSAPASAVFDASHPVTQAQQRLKAREAALGGVPQGYYLNEGPTGLELKKDVSNAAALGKAALGTAIGAGAAFGAPAIVGALGGGAGAGTGAGYIASDIAASVPSAGGFWSGLVGGAKSAGASLLGKAKGAFTDPEALGEMGLGLAGGMTANREGQMGRDLQRDALRLREAEGFENNQQGRARLVLDQRADERTAQSDAFRKALIGRLTQNVQDASFDRSGFNNVSDIRLNGGLRPSALGAEGRATGGVLEAQALRALTNPEPRPEMAPIERTQPTAEKKGGFWEGLIGAGGLVGSALGKLRKPGGYITDDVNDVEQGLHTR